MSGDNSSEDQKAAASQAGGAEIAHADPLTASYLEKLHSLQAVVEKGISRIQRANGTITGDLVLESVKEITDGEFGARAIGMAAARGLGLGSRVTAASAAQEEISQPLSEAQQSPS